ncbi:predicted protein [Uncinocarpus reesii 1704]|uniref:Uncharacterized protein n=1 Tax=Uncinocarpus reesii (strain UAMH 1704) TaxID=336963 RepID=C4JSY1_UNCRE|nr:uncharacterized protein UREG_05570 [Uncinocarpus reesii 1704]EEP80728.1 predicted protein [Uncinocarpus reesii 1704]
MNDSDDYERVSRLQILQMEDLGLARRDYLSTRDEGSKQRLSLRHLEAFRASNQEGTQSQRLAEENKDKLDAWKNAWKTIEGQGEGEDLAPIMEGQSHRYNLIQAIKNKGGQKYDTEPDTSVHPRGRRALGAPGGAGRGGGVMGARGRQQPMVQKSYVDAACCLIFVIALLTLVYARLAVAAKQRSKAAIIPPISGRPLDPARNINNPQSPPRRGGAKGRGAGRPMRPVTMRHRIPVTTLSSEQTRSGLGGVESCDDADTSDMAMDIEGDESSEAENLEAAEEKLVRGSLKSPTPERPILKALEVFGSPSARYGNQTDSLKQKVDKGFSSSLPQPRSPMKYREPATYDSDSDDDDESILLPGTESPTVVNDEPEPATSPQPSTIDMNRKDRIAAEQENASVVPRSSAVENQGENELSTAKQELAELEQTLSTGMLPVSVINVLKLRKKELEEIIFVKSTRPIGDAPSDIPAPREMFKKPFTAPARALPLPDEKAPVQREAPSAQIGMQARQTALEPTRELKTSRVDDAVRTSTFPMSNDETSIIGNHLLPGREGKSDPIIPPAFAQGNRRPRRAHLDANVPWPHRRNLDTPDKDDIPMEDTFVAENAKPSQPSTTRTSASQPRYGSQLKMRETPYLPQTAAAMQYAGQLSNMPLTNERPQLQVPVHTATPPTSTNAARTDSFPLRDSYQVRQRIDSVRVGNENNPPLETPQTRLATCTPNNPFFSRRGNENLSPVKQAGSKPGGLADSMWAPAPSAPQQGTFGKNVLNSGETFQRGSQRDNKPNTRGNDLMASRWAH